MCDSRSTQRTWLLAPPQSPHSSWPPPLEAGRLLRGGLAGERTLDGGGGVYGRFSTSALIFSRRNCRRGGRRAVIAGMSYGDCAQIALTCAEQSCSRDGGVKGLCRVLRPQ